MILGISNTSQKRNIPKQHSFGNSKTSIPEDTPEELINVTHSQIYTKYLDPKTNEEKFIKSSELIHINPITLYSKIITFLLKETITPFSLSFHKYRKIDVEFNTIFEQEKNIYLKEKDYEDFHELINLTLQQIKIVVEFLGSTTFKLERLKEIEKLAEFLQNGQVNQPYFQTFQIFYLIWIHEISTLYSLPINFKIMTDDEITKLSLILSSFTNFIQNLLRISNIDTNQLLTPDSRQSQHKRPFIIPNRYTRNELSNLHNKNNDIFDEEETLLKLLNVFFALEKVIIQ